MKRREVHILLGCADARDLSQLHVDAVENATRQFALREIEIEFHVIRAPGSFVTADVCSDVKQTIRNSQQQAHSLPEGTRYFVHIQTHGQLQLAGEREEEFTQHTHATEIVAGSPLNCGMLGATSVGVELERLLIEEQLTFSSNGRTLTIDSEDDIRVLLREKYNYDGYLAGDWVRSIDDLRTHPRRQRTILEDFIRRDADLRELGIGITAGLQDYALHALVRLDGGEPVSEFWDLVQLCVRACRPPEVTKEIMLKQAEKQKPLAGLFCLTDPRLTSRTLAAEYYLKQEQGQEPGTDYLPNLLFNLSGSSFDDPTSTFGPYIVAGFYYAVRHLGLTDQLVMGHDETQTERILQKINNDPIMNLIVRKFGVRLLPINQLALSH